MVTLQILVLPFLVRVRVPQLKRVTQTSDSFSFYVLAFYFSVMVLLVTIFWPMVSMVLSLVMLFTQPSACNS